MTIQNGFATHFQASLLNSMRMESLASSQSGLIVDADAWCKRVLKPVIMRSSPPGENFFAAVKTCDKNIANFVLM